MNLITIYKDKRFQIYALLVAMCFVFYGNTIKNYYSEDDYRVTSDFRRKNTLVEKGFDGIKEIFKSRYSDTKIEDLEVKYGYRPVARATFAVEWALWGQNPHNGHIINILIYCLTTCLLYFVLSRSVFRNKDPLYPLLTTLLFIAHPIHTEVVASLKNREELLSFLFGLLFISFNWKLFSTKNIIYMWLALSSLILSVLSKETGIIYLVIAPLIIFFFHAESKRDLTLKERVSYTVMLLILLTIYVIYREWDYSIIAMLLSIVALWVNKKWYPSLTIFFSLSVIIFFVTWALPEASLDAAKSGKYFWANPLFGNPTLSERAGMVLNTLLFDLKLLFYPHPLGFYYGYNVIPLTGIFSGRALLSLAIVIGLLYAVIKQYKKQPIVAFTIIFFFFSIAPFVNIFAFNGITADRVLYAPSLAFCIGLTLVLFKLKGLLKDNTNRVLYFATAIICFVYLIKVVTRNQDWENYYTLYGKGARDFPNSAKANSMYATLLYDSVDLEKNIDRKKELIKEAIKHFEVSLKVYPGYPESLNALGTIYYKLGKYDKALFYYKKNYDLNPDYTPVYVNVGSVYQMLSDYKNAKYFYKIALEKDKKYPTVYLNMYDLYNSENKPDSALYILKLAIQNGVKDGEIINLLNNPSGNEKTIPVK